MASVNEIEVARALDGILLSAAYCNLERLSSPGGGAEVPWNGPPEWVTAPYVVPQPNELVFEESGCLVLQPYVGDKLLILLNICVKEIEY